jgi:hypothetical protein
MPESTIGRLRRWNHLSPDPAAGSDLSSGPFAMTISILLRTEKMADLRRVFKARRDLNQSELESHADTCVAGANTM